METQHTTMKNTIYSQCVAGVEIRDQSCLCDAMNPAIFYTGAVQNILGISPLEILSKVLSRLECPHHQQNCIILQTTRPLEIPKTKVSNAIMVK